MSDLFSSRFSICAESTTGIGKPDRFSVYCERLRGHRALLQRFNGRHGEQLATLYVRYLDTKPGTEGSDAARWAYLNKLNFALKDGAKGARAKKAEDAVADV